MINYTTSNWFPYSLAPAAGPAGPLEEAGVIERALFIVVETALGESAEPGSHLVKGGCYHEEVHGISLPRRLDS